MSDYNNKYVLNKVKMTTEQRVQIYELNNMDIHSLIKLRQIVAVFNMTGDNTDNESLLLYIDAIIERIGDEMCPETSTITQEEK
jgi:hypothetical protein